MSIDHSQPDALSIAPSRLIKPSHRTRPEQTVGFFIYLLLCMGFELLNRWLGSNALYHTWFRSLLVPPWVFSGWPITFIWIGYHLSLSLSMWTLWRRFSLRTLKLELSLFLSQFLFFSIWSLSSFLFHEPLLALVSVLLLFSNLLLSSLVFWKRERLSGQLLIPSILWIFYIMGIAMAICISNP